MVGSLQRQTQQTQFARKGVASNTTTKAAAGGAACDPVDIPIMEKKETDSGGADSQMGGQTDRKHTHVGLISQSGWSDRSSPSGSTQCPFQRSSEAPIGQGCEERLVRWKRG